MNDSSLVIAAASTAAASTSSAIAIVAQSAATDGLNPTTGWAGGIIIGGVGVFGWLYRQMKNDAERHAAERRDADHKKDAQLEDLQRRLDAANEEIKNLLRGRS